MTLQQQSRVIRRRLIDRISGLGLFTSVLGYEAGSAPTNPDGIHCAIVDGEGELTPTASTLANSAITQRYNIHLYRLLPLQDDDTSEQVDPVMADAVYTVLDSLQLVTGFGTGVEIDLLGAHGERVRWSPGYLDWDGSKYRTRSIGVGFILFNAMEQSR